MEPQPEPNAADQDNNDGLGPEFADALNEWSPAKVAYDQAVEEGNIQNIKIAYERLSAAHINIIKTLAMIDGDINSNDATDFAKKLDFSKPLTNEGQGFSADSTNSKILAKITGDTPGKIQYKVGILQDWFDKNIFTSDFRNRFINAKTPQDLADLQTEGNSKIDRLIKNIGDILKAENTAIFLKYLLFFLLAGGVALKIFDLIKKALCASAQSSSGCMYQQPDGTIVKVQIDESKISGNPCNEDDYNTMCGGCDQGYLQNGVMPTCCNPGIAVDPSKYPVNAVFQYKCESPLGVFDNFFNGLANWFNPGNIMSMLEKIGIIAGIIIGIVIVAYVIHWFMKEEEDSGKNEHISIEMPSSSSSK
jgi:hypothetical protein